jgi:uncharacterized protein involved in exopolysaccharide biosynthesis
LDAQDAIELRKTAITKRSDELKVFALKLQAADEQLNTQVKRHTPRTRAELASYNAAVDRRNTAVRQLNERSAELQKAQDSLNDNIFKLNEQCGVLSIPLEVKAAAEEERRARAKK